MLKGESDDPLLGLVVVVAQAHDVTFTKDGRSTLLKELLGGGEV